MRYGLPDKCVNCFFTLPSGKGSCTSISTLAITWCSSLAASAVTPCRNTGFIVICHCVVICNDPSFTHIDVVYALIAPRNEQINAQTKFYSLKQCPLLHIPAIYWLNHSCSRCLAQAIHSTSPNLFHHSLCFSLPLAPLLLKQPSIHFLLVTLVVQQQQSIQHFAPHGITNRIPQTLLRLVKAVL